jgi:hypothetical protein
MTRPPLKQRCRLVCGLSPLTACHRRSTQLLFWAELLKRAPLLSRLTTAAAQFHSSIQTARDACKLSFAATTPWSAGDSRRVAAQTNR